MMAPGLVGKRFIGDGGQQRRHPVGLQDFAVRGQESVEKDEMTDRLRQPIGVVCREGGYARSRTFRTTFYSLVTSVLVPVHA